VNPRKYFDTLETLSIKKYQNLKGESDMKFHSPMIIVADIEKSKKFYTDILHETISLDLGNYVVMGGFSMMARETWNEQTKDNLVPANKNAHCFELYFEESELDNFVAQLNKNTEVKQFQPLTEAPWGQRTLRFLDPDDHVIEVSEPMKEVVLRLLASGMTEPEVSEKSMMPIEFVKKCVEEQSRAV
jgi:catechol 2,3-dioxygenase-like lactoylglutathione lyase family enzyme